MSLPFPALIPGTDEDRLLALSRYQVVGTAPESLFDSFAALTAKLFNAPIALVSLVANDSVWFKAHFGLPGARQVARTESLCSVAILTDQATVFEDLTARPCALIDPRVLQELKLRFYAGQPLRTADGFNIGALCVIDRQARTFSPDEQELLQQLAVTVVLLLELRRAQLGPAGAPGSAWAQTVPTLPPLVHSLTLLAEIGSTGAAVDIQGRPVHPQAIHAEARHLTELINQTLSTTLAG